jgi:hypothetical protein
VVTGAGALLVEPELPPESEDGEVPAAEEEELPFVDEVVVAGVEEVADVADVVAFEVSDGSWPFASVT